MKLADSCILLTGSSRGIGAACAVALQAEGAQVILHGRSADRLAAPAAALGAKTLTADLRDPDAPRRLAQDARDVFGRIDAVVHCAGAGWYGTTADMAPEAIDDLLAVNLRAPIQLTRELLPGMVARGYGHVSFIGSIAGLTGVAKESVYSAAKAGLITFAESLRLELHGSGVGVSVVSPVAVRTEFFAARGTAYSRGFPRQVGPERIAASVLRGLKRNRAHQIVPRWVAAAPVARATVPPVFRALNRRFG
jgi:short-subunit dehydrogenase